MYALNASHFSRNHIRNGSTDRNNSIPWEVFRKSVNLKVIPR